MSTNKDPLISIIGNELRVKMLRVFVLNKDAVYTAKEFAKTLRKREQSVKDELRQMEKDRVIKKKKIAQAERKNKDSKETSGYGFNKRYTHQIFLEKIIRESVPSEKEVLAKKIARVPGVQCIITTDIFDEAPTTQIDLVVASSKDNEALLRELVKDAEQMIGRELRCAFLTVNDLIYRIQVNDKFMRDILDGTYQVHLDKTGSFKE